MTIHIQGATAPNALAAMTVARRIPSMAAMRAGVRAQVELEIEGLIDLLDKLDGDPERETTGDEEPSLGWPEWQGHRAWTGAGNCGREKDRGDDREEDAGDEGEATNEHGGNVLDEPHDDDDPAEDADTGIGDHDGLLDVLARDCGPAWPRRTREQQDRLNDLMRRAMAMANRHRADDPDELSCIAAGVGLWSPLLDAASILSVKSVQVDCDRRPSLRIFRHGEGDAFDHLRHARGQ